MVLIPSNQAKDFINEVKKYDPNQERLLDWNDKKYFSDVNYITNSMLKYLNDSPEHLHAYLNYPAWRQEKQAYIDGSALHCFILEPEEFDNRFWFINDTDIIEEIGGAKPRATKRYKEWKIEIQNDNLDKQEISYEWYLHLTLIEEKLKAIPQVKQLLANTKKEKAYFKKLNGINCKCKVDAVNIGNYIVDLKGFKETPNPYNFLRNLKKYNLDRQAALYCDILGLDQFWFICVEKTYPYTVGIYEVSAETLQAGREKYEYLLEVHKNNLNNYDKEYVNNFCYFGTI